MISERMTQAMNEQIVKEYYSGYFYMQMAAYFDSENLDGFSNWMRVQAQEEASHAQIFFNHLCERGAEIKLGAIDAPPTEFKNALDVFEQGLEHEKLVTASIDNLVTIAEEEKDRASQSMLQWFVDEQVEEESNFDGLRAKLARIGDGNGLYMLDRECAARVFTMPSPLAGGE